MEHYENERKREYYEIDNLHHKEIAETAEILEQYGLQGEDLNRVVGAIASNRDKWVDFMMRFELNLEKPDPKRAPVSAATIGGSYILGGFIPLFPYMIVDTIESALVISVVMTLITLAAFGGIKAKLTGLPIFRGAIQTMFVGGLAAAVAFMVARLIS